MNPIETGQAYDTITHRWSEESFNMQNGIDQHKKAISFANYRGKALDVGCGSTGRLINLLLKEGFTPEGIDVSEKKVELSRKRFPQLSIYYDDICTWVPNKKYDFITAWDSIWHVPLADQSGLMLKLISLLNDQGVLIFSFGGVEKAGDHTDDTMGPMMYYSSLGTSGYLELFMHNGCSIKHLEFDQYPEYHSYLIAQKI